MPDADNIVRDRQRAMRREIDRRGIALKAIHFDSGIPMQTLLSYFPAGENKPAVMPATALFRLLAGNALPHDILSLILPDGEQIVRVPEDVDHDDLEAAARDYLAEKGKAHRPDSPAARDLSSCETVALNKRAARLVAAANA